MSRVRKNAIKWQAQVAYRAISSLTLYENNPKEHSDVQNRALARSLSTYGFVSPVLIDTSGVVIAGHARIAAAKLAGIDQVPTITLGHLTPAQQRAYRIADNRLSEIGVSWSIEKLNMEVEAILRLDTSFDLSITGFDTRDLQLSLDAASAADEPSDPEVPPVAANAVSRLGDLWRIGDHALFCGDALKDDSYTALLGSERVDMSFGDGPYNVPILGHVGGKGKIKHREFVAASGEMSPAEFHQFLLGYLLQSARVSKPGSLHFACIDWRSIKTLLTAGEVAFDELKNICVWSKSQGGMGSLYRSQHELIAVFKKGGAPHTNNVELGKNGRNRTNVWSYSGMNSFSSERDEMLALHPTVKPLALVRDAILDASNRDDLVLDPFGGSGTTLLAADACSRRARLIELDPLYCDVIVRRAQKVLGVDAVLASTGQPFDLVAGEREAAHV